MSKLRNGFTTGTCAAAASRAAVYMLLTGNLCENINVVLPNGDILSLNIENIEINKEYVKCSVKKDSGDDPDITNGIDIFSKVSKCHSGINISGGEGIGVVTRKGLNQPVGEYAINSKPRKSIEDNILSLCDNLEYFGGINVEISAPKGVELAKKTFNPRLGIEGGISILGTTGIVEPMSEKALVDTIKTELNMVRQYHNEAVAVFGNYGADFAVKNLGVNRDLIVTMSNFVGDCILTARDMNFSKLTIVGHIGKMVKLSGGITNTHSKYSDCRMELMASCGIEVGADINILRKILRCNTTDEVCDFLYEKNILEPVMERLVEKIKYYTNINSEDMEVDIVVFSNKYGILGKG
ncbi:MAG: cobalt-precorrin-5B (C(1))-methyltransferase CbiD [Lachnospirales bacterium]